MKKILLGAVLTLALLLLSALAVARLGLMPVSADGSHSRVEARIMPAVLHASVVRHASGETNPVALNEDHLKAGVDTYKAMCARCHSKPDGEATTPERTFSVHRLATLLGHKAWHKEYGNACLGKHVVGRGDLAARRSA